MKSFVILCSALILGLASCKDDSIYDNSKPIQDNAWSYKDKKDNYVNIRDTAAVYSLYFNVRITNNYHYSNLFVLLNIYYPKGPKPSPQRLEFKLASPSGEWLGIGSGSVYTYQIPFAQNVRFSKAGVYNFQLEQNMRDQPLREVVDAGIRLQKVNR